MKEFSNIELKRMTDDMIIKAIGEYIRSVRLDRNLTQEQLGERQVFIEQPFVTLN